MCPKCLLVNIPSYSPVDFSDKRRKMIGPSSVMDTTQRIESTTTKTEQKERANWHLCLFTSLNDCLMKNLNLPQQFSPVNPSSSSSSSYFYGFAVTSSGKSGVLVLKKLPG